MNPIWIKAAPWLVCLALILALMSMTHLYMAERDEFTKFKAAAEQAGKDGKEREDKLRDDHKGNLIELEKIHGKDKDIAIADAVRNYRLRHPNTDSGRLCGASPSETLGDGTEPELVSVEPAFIRECAKDSGKVNYFQDYCIRNRCPVED